MRVERFAVAPALLPADNNIRDQYPIHKGKWVRHPETDAHDPSFCRFVLDFELTEPATIDLHVSADNRFELTCDGQYVGMGPDRSDLDHWSFHAYRLQLNAGPHRLEAETHYLGVSARFRPWAQTCIEPGFVLVAQGSPVDLNTGTAPWRVVKLTGVGYEQPGQLRAFMVVGPNYTIDARDYFNPPQAVEPAVLRGANDPGESGKIQPGWKLYPSNLPEQTRDPVAGGRIRRVTDVGPDAAFPSSDLPNAPAPADAWQRLIEQRGAVTIPPRTRLVVLWDLDEYRTAYPELTTTGGVGSTVRLDWAESCFDTPPDTQGPTFRQKGNRNAIDGKYFRGNGDAFLPDGPTRTMKAYWWRAGRYVRITVETADHPLTIDRLRLLESRFPLNDQSTFVSNDDALPPVIKIAERGIQMCAHETYMDCPYYEQLMYSGDTRLQALTAFVMNPEDRLNQRMLELFDWSRQETGFVHERYPSQPKQLSLTFSMIWILMVRDYAWWRNDERFVRQRLKGVRCMLEEFKALPAPDAPLLAPLPGWSFVDWMPGLSQVNHPGRDTRVHAITSLLFLNALDSAAELEDACGEPHLRDYNRAWAKRLAEAIDRTFWTESRALFSDDPAHTTFSEHAQCLALLTDHFPHRNNACLASLIGAPDLTRTTVYFSFYLLDVFAKFGRGDLLHAKLDFWKNLAAIGMKTPVEMPEPSRSDCHAWGSHPLFHLHASLAGIRPASPGFKTVRIAPSPGPLTHIESTIPHPAGSVSLTMRREAQDWRARVSLPAGVDGTLHWQGRSHPISGSTELRLPS